LKDTLLTKQKTKVRKKTQAIINVDNANSSLTPSMGKSSSSGKKKKSINKNNNNVAKMNKTKNTKKKKPAAAPAKRAHTEK
jgi:hypothetical protein